MLSVLALGLFVVAVDHLSDDPVALAVEVEVRLALEHLVQEIAVYQHQRISLAVAVDGGPD